MYRLIVILILLGILYWVVKRAFFLPKSRAAGSQEIGEEMIQDPVCGCYVPKSQAFTLSHRGKKLYFCSQVCSQKYQSSNALPKN
jgi:YHS domain-containing protein